MTNGTMLDPITKPPGLKGAILLDIVVPFSPFKVFMPILFASAEKT